MLVTMLLPTPPRDFKVGNGDQLLAALLVLPEAQVG